VTPRPLDDDPAVQEIAEVVRSAEERLRDLAYDRLREAVEQGADKVSKEQRRLEQARRALARALHALAPESVVEDGP